LRHSSIWSLDTPRGHMRMTRMRVPSLGSFSS
jgi:hypothetical protein